MLSTSWCIETQITTSELYLFFASDLPLPDYLHDLALLREPLQLSHDRNEYCEDITCSIRTLYIILADLGIEFTGPRGRDYRDRQISYSRLKIRYSSTHQIHVTYPSPPSIPPHHLRLGESVGAGKLSRIMGTTHYKVCLP